jgi:hypothetical protein
MLSSSVPGGLIWVTGQPVRETSMRLRTFVQATTETDSGHSDLRRRAVSYDLSGERLTERGLSGRRHRAPGAKNPPSLRRSEVYPLVFRQYYRDPYLAVMLIVVFALDDTASPLTAEGHSPASWHCTISGQQRRCPAGGSRYGAAALEVREIWKAACGCASEARR